MLRSPYPHARIGSIDTSKAEALPGLKAVITAKDLPFASLSKEELGGDYGRLKFASDHMLASDKALFKGHPVAAVAAVNAHIAESALALIEVDYEPLPAVVDVLEAMKDGAPLLHEELRTSAMGEIADKPSNVASHLSYEKGDVGQGFAEADVIVEREYTTASVHQGYIEPHNSTAMWNVDGQVSVWTSTQGAFAVRAAVADVLRLPVSRVKVTPMEIGGGFGGKITAYLDAVTAVLSKKAGAPVKQYMTRAEVFEASGPAPGSWMKVKVGAKNDGHLTAVQMEVAMDAGAYPGSHGHAWPLAVLHALTIRPWRETAKWSAAMTWWSTSRRRPLTRAPRVPAVPCGVGRRLDRDWPAAGRIPWVQRAGWIT